MFAIRAIYENAAGNPPITDLRFSYGAASYRAFKGQYLESNGTRFWAARKVIALPAALLAGVVLSIYHLAKLLFIDLRQSFL